MIYKRKFIAVACVATSLLLAACSSSNKRTPANLGAEPTGMTVRSVWSNKVGSIQFPLQMQLQKSRVAVASSDGTVALLDANTGADLWRTSAGSGVTAGAGHDGETVAVANSNNEIVVLRAGAVLWKYRMPSRVFTAPLVAGARVFVLAGDRSVTAFDADSGRRLWSQTRTQSESLVLEQGGVLTAVGNTLVAGFAGRLVGMNPGNGSTLWEAVFAASRATNDVERLIDVVGPVSRVGQSVCARAYQNAVGCMDIAEGRVAWTKASAGYVGLGGDDKYVFGAEADGVLVAYSRDKGEKLWSHDKFLYRDLTAAQSTGTALVVGDGSGYLHWLARDTGQTLARVQIDSSPVVYSPLAAGGRVIAVTRNGAVSAYAAQ